jgi:hypothetical protein
VPQTGDEIVHLNLWLINGSPPAGNAPVECVIKSFQFVPLGSPQPATLSGALRTGNLVRFSINGQTDRRYLVQTSTNLAGWQALTTVLATNNTTDVVVTNIGGSGKTFFRTITLP